MSNLPEEAGKAIATIADSFKGSPACLAAILLAAMFALLTYFSLVAERSEMHERQMKLIDHCFPPMREKIVLPLDIKNGP